MNGPDVSVVVPVFNTMPYLTATLDSLVGQSIGLDRIQVVAVDDGSTDGSGAELDRYAARYPGSFTVLHQENSGGPARPCNAGLEVARGRYVFFLGADDYLGEEALERMVAAADTWSSDVLCVRIVGVGGRWVNQRLYAEDRRDVPFPGELLATALGNTKLFRRSLLEDHRIRYALDLKVGSDQPFTIEAMMRARRVSVLGDYDYYYAVKRDDGSNITYSSSWRSRFEGISSIVRHVAELIDPGPGRDDVLGRHFSGEIATLLRRDFAELDPADQGELVALVAGLAAEFLTPPMLPRLTVPARLRYRLAASGDLAGLRELVGVEDRPSPLLLDAERAVIAYPGYGTRFAVADYVAAGDRLGRHLVAATGPARITATRTLLRVEVPLDLLPGSRPAAGVALSPMDGSDAPGPRERPGDAAPDLVVVPAVHVDGVLVAELPLDRLVGLGGARPGRGRAALRIQFAVGARTWEVPVKVDRATGVVAADKHGRGWVRLDPGASLLRRVRARLGRKD